MKLDKGRSTDFLSLPADEAEKVIEAMKQAEQTNDIEALKWAARRIAWLDDTSEIIHGDDDFHPAHIFNKAWAQMLESDPPPESIAEIICNKDEPKPPTAEETKRIPPKTEVFLELADEIAEAQIFIERMETVLGEVVDDYFNDLRNNPDTLKGKELIVLFFNQNRILSDIAHDCMIRLRNTIGNMKALIEQGGYERFDPIDKLNKLCIAAIKLDKCKELINVLEKHGGTEYAGFPLSKYRALDADLVGLIMEEAKVS